MILIHKVGIGAGVSTGISAYILFNYVRYRKQQVDPYLYKMEIRVNSLPTTSMTVNTIEQLLMKALGDGKPFGTKVGINYVPYVITSANKYGLDPVLLFAIMWQESRWGETLSTKGPDGTGDHGHGRGLMQIDDRAHRDWIAKNNWQDPATNISYGAKVLADNVSFFKNKGYSGNELTFNSLAAYNTGAGNVMNSIKAQISAEHTTANRNYSSSVLSHYKKIMDSL